MRRALTVLCALLASTLALGVAPASADEPPRLRFGDRGPAVATLQRALDIDVTSYFNQRTYHAVKTLQRREGLRVSGVADLPTWRALGPRASRNAARHTAQEGAGTAPGARVCPVRRAVFGDGFGAPRWHGGHDGVDLLGRRGATIMSVDSGKVRRAGWQSNGSLVVEIVGARGMWYYGHLDSVSVRAGDRVRAGESIGEMGDTGSPGTVHLHIEWHPGGAWSGAVDPEPLLRSLC